MKILKVKQLRDFVTLQKNYFSNNYKVTCENKSKYLRKTTYRFTVPFARNQHGNRRRSYIIPILFNKLPESLFNMNKPGEIKRQLKT